MNIFNICLNGSAALRQTMDLEVHGSNPTKWGKLFVYVCTCRVGVRVRERVNERGVREWMKQGGQGGA